MTACTTEPTIDENLRRRSVSGLRLVLLVMLGLAATGIMIFASMPSQGNSIFRNYLNDTGHVFVFCISTVATFGILALWQLPVWIRLLAAISLSLGFGVAIEVVQHFIPARSASLKDVARDMLGILAGLFFILALTRQTQRPRIEKWRRKAGIGLAVLCLLIGLIPMSRCLAFYGLRNRAFPVMFNAEDKWWDIFVEAVSADFWVADLPADWPEDADRRGLQVRLHHPRTITGIGLRNPFPKWTGYKSLNFDLYVLDEVPCELTLVVRDKWTIRNGNDQFQRRILLKPGFQSIEIPLDEILNGPPTRELDFKKIDSIYLFAPKTNREINFVIDSLLLK